MGKGKFSKVFLGRHLITGCVVVLKKALKTKLKEYNIVEQFIKEVMLHNSMDHLKIVRFYAFFDESGSFYLILE